jgi:hypothetical protein
MRTERGKDLGIRRRRQLYLNGSRNAPPAEMPRQHDFNRRSILNALRLRDSDGIPPPTILIAPQRQPSRAGKAKVVMCYFAPSGVAKLTVFLPDGAILIWMLIWGGVLLIFPFSAIAPVKYKFNDWELGEDCVLMGTCRMLRRNSNINLVIGKSATPSKRRGKAPQAQHDFFAKSVLPCPDEMCSFAVFFMD